MTATTWKFSRWWVSPQQVYRKGFMSIQCNCPTLLVQKIWISPTYLRGEFSTSPLEAMSNALHLTISWFFLIFPILVKNSNLDLLIFLTLKTYVGLFWQVFMVLGNCVYNLWSYWDGIFVENENFLVRTLIYGICSKMKNVASFFTQIYT